MSQRGRAIRLFLAGSIIVFLVVTAHNAFSNFQDRQLDFERESIRAELDGFFQRYTSVLEGDDYSVIESLYVDAERFAWFTDGRQLYDSAADIVASLKGLRDAGLDVRTSIQNSEIVVLSANIATLSAEFDTRAIARGEEAFAYSGVITIVVERQPDGAWKVVRGHSSTPGGPPTPFLSETSLRWAPSAPPALREAG